MERQICSTVGVVTDKYSTCNGRYYTRERHVAFWTLDTVIVVLIMVAFNGRCYTRERHVAF
jgi:hypothetical protein